MFPTTLFVTAIFKNSNTKKKKKEDEVADSVFKEYDDIDALLGEIYEDEEERRERIEDKEPTKCKRCCDKTLLIIAWIVANLGVISSAFFAILYSMQWGIQQIQQMARIVPAFICAECILSRSFEGL